MTKQNTSTTNQTETQTNKMVNQELKESQTNTYLKLTEIEKEENLTPTTVLEQTETLTQNENTIQNENSTQAQNSTQEEPLQTQTSVTKINAKKLSFWLGLLAILIVGVQVLLNYFGVMFEAKITIEICSYLLALLLSIGVLSGTLKGKNIVETKENIEKQLKTEIENISNKTNKK